MSISLYTPPGQPDDEPSREKAVTGSGLLNQRQSDELERIAARAAATLGTAMAAITLIHQERQIILAAVGLTATETSRSVSFCGHAILDPQNVMVVPDTHADERFAGNPLVLADPHLRFYAGAPIVSADGQALGTLCVFDRYPRTSLSAEDEAALRTLAADVLAPNNEDKPA
ncbi:MAG: GAF domain-containing protein [Sphingomonas fennica]